MSPNSTTLAESRAWADGLCAQLQHSARHLDFWDKQVHNTRHMSWYRVRRNYNGKSHRDIQQKAQQYRQQFLDTPLYPDPESPHDKG